MKKLLSTILFCSAVLGLNAQSNTSKTYTLADWNLKNWDAQSGVLTLDVSEYKHGCPAQQ